MAAASSSVSCSDSRRGSQGDACYSMIAIEKVMKEREEGILERYSRAD